MESFEDIINRPDLQRVARKASDMPECVCKDKGQPMTQVGVLHLSDCAWFQWFRSSGGCQGDV